MVPLLAAANAKVVATASTQVGGKFLRNLGAEQIVGYDAAGYPQGVDAVFNLALFGDQLTPAAQVLRSGGRLLSIIYPAPTPEQVGRHDVTVHVVMDLEGKFGGMPGVAAAAAAGNLAATIARRYSLDDAVQAAVDYVRRSPLGKNVVTMVPAV